MSKASASRKASGSAASKKKAGKKKPVAKKVTQKKAPAKKKIAKKAPAKSAAKKPTSKKKTTKKSLPKKKAAVKKKIVKKAAKKAAATKKKTVTKKTAAKKATTKKTVTKKTTPKKAAVKKAPAKKKAASGKRAAPVAKKTKAVAKKSPPKRTIKRPRVPYASLSEARPAPYNPHDHTPPTTAQLRKVKTGLTPKDRRTFRQLLLERRAEIIGDVQGLEAACSGNAGEISHMPLHMADVGSDNYEQEFMLGLMESERRIIIEIDDALQRLVDKTYGVCIESGEPIGRPRLEAKPWAKYCIEVARERERRGAR